MSATLPRLGFYLSTETRHRLSRSSRSSLASLSPIQRCSEIPTTINTRRLHFFSRGLSINSMDTNHKKLSDDQHHLEFSRGLATNNPSSIPNLTARIKDSIDCPKDDDDHIEKESPSDDRIDKRAYPIAFSSLLMGIGIGVILPVMPQFANEVGINQMQYGLVISVMGLTRLIMNVPAGLWTDRYGRKSTLVGGPLFACVGTLVMSAATSFNHLILSRIVTGCGGALQMAGAQAYLSDISTTANRARTMAPLMIGFSAGATLGPFVGGFLCDYYDSVRVPFYFVAGAMSLVAANNMWVLPETLRKEDRKRQKGDLSQTLRNMQNEWGWLIRDTSTRSGVLVHMVYWFAVSGATFTLMPQFAVNDLGMTATQLGGIFAMMSVVNICGAQLFAKISDKYGRKKVIVPAVAIISAMLPLIPHVSTLHELYALMAVYSIGATMLGTSPTAYISDLHSGSKEKEERRTQALAMLRSGGDIGLLIGSGLLGTLAHSSGSVMLPMCTASACLFASGLNFAINADETVRK